MVGSFVGLVRDLLLSLGSVFNGIVEGILGRIYELGKRVFQLLDRLIFGRDVFEAGFGGPVRLNGYLAQDLLVRNDKGSGKSYKGQDVNELHDCCDIKCMFDAVMAVGKKKEDQS